MCPIQCIRPLSHFTFHLYPYFLPLYISTSALSLSCSSLFSLATPLLCNLFICLSLYIASLSSFPRFFLAIHTVGFLGFSLSGTLLKPWPSYSLHSLLLHLHSSPFPSQILLLLGLEPLFWSILRISPAS